jgi:hypothetical protein
MFFASGGKKVRVQQLDHNEELEILQFTIDEVADLVMRQEIKQSVHANCILFALIKLGKLKFGRD